MSDNPFAPYAAAMRGETPDDTTAPAVRGQRSAAPNSYMDPAWDDAEAEAEQVTGVPAGVLRAIRVAGERSNGDQVSPVGARGVYQFMPATRDAFAKKYGVDAYSPDPTEQSTAAALHLKESYARTGDWTRAMAGYNGGISAERGTNTTKENRDYTSRVARAFNEVNVQRGSSSPSSPSEPVNPFMGLGELLAGDPPEAAPAPQPKQEGFLSSVFKNALPWMAEGVNTTAASLAGAADWAGTAVGIDTPDWGVRKFFEGNADTTRDWQSDSMQALIRQTDAETEKVRAEQGEWAAMKFRAAQLVKHPELAMRLGFTNAATIVPGMTAIKGAQLVGAGARLALGAGAATNAALNAGDAWGDSYDSIYKEAHKRALASGATPEQAAADAQDMARLGAQLPAAIGFITGLPAGATGLEAVVAGTARKSALGLGGALAKGGVADVVKAATNTSLRKAAARGLKSGLAEVGGELPEELLPAIAGNVALGELDGETTWSKGLGAHAVDTIAGAGPFGAYGGVRHARETRADAREMAKLLTDPSVPAEQKAAARDEIVAQAQRAGVAPEQVDAWLDEQFMEDDAAAEAEAAERESASQADREAGEQRRAMDERVQASRGAAERNQALRDVLDRNLGMGEPTPGRDGAADMQAALDEPTGEMASDENGWERPQTAGEAMGIAAAQQVAPPVQPAPEAPQAPAPQTPAQQVAAREAARNARGRKEFGIVKKQALATFADVDQAFEDGLIDENTYQTMAGLLAGDAVRLADVRGDIARVRQEELNNAKPDLTPIKDGPVPDTAAIEADLNAQLGARDAQQQAPALAPGVEFANQVDARRKQRGQRALTPTERRRTYLALGFDAQGQDPTGSDGSRNPMTLEQIASMEEQLTGKRPTVQAVAKTLNSVGLSQKLIKTGFAVETQEQTTESAEDAASRGEESADAQAEAEEASDEDIDETVEEARRAKREAESDGGPAKLDRATAAVRMYAEGKITKAALTGVLRSLGMDVDPDTTVEGLRAALGMDVDPEPEPTVVSKPPAEARKVESKSNYNDKAVPSGIDPALAKALGWDEELLDAVPDAQKDWDEGAPKKMKFSTLPLAAQAEWVWAFNMSNTEDGDGGHAMSVSELVRVRDEIVSRMRKDGENAEVDVDYTEDEGGDGHVPLARLPSLDPSLTGGIEGEWRADTPLHMVSDAKARMVAWVRAKVPGLGVGLGGLDSRGEKVTSNTVARGSTLERTLVAAYKSVADSPLGRLFNLVSPRLQSLTVFTGKGLQGVNGFFSRELGAVHLRINTELVEAAAGRIGGTVMTARVVGHEMAHAADWFAGKELGLKHFASVNPGGPLAIEVDTRADGTVNLELGPVMQELVGLYTGETYGQTDGTNRGAVPGADAGLSEGHDLGRSGPGIPGSGAEGRVQQQVPGANLPRVERTAGGANEGPRAGGVEPAARQGAPRSASAAQGSGRGPVAHTGLIAGLDFDQALHDFTRDHLPRVARGKSFSKAKLADLVHDADTATKEALARLSEAYLADPEALQAEAPQAFALMEQLAKAKSLVEAGQLLAGMQPVKARKGAPKGGIDPQRAWHGTPHKGIENTGFKLNAIGTGEGAQVYGWGMYFASVRAVAEHYRKGLSYRNLARQFMNELPEDASTDEALEAAENGELPEPVANVVKALAADDWLGFDYPAQAITAAFKELDNFDPSPALRKAIREYSGQLYQVEIPEDSDLLAWDKPLRDQPPKVREALRNGPIDLEYLANDKGSRVYETLAAWAAENNGDESGSDPVGASRYLQSIGIPGLRYLDGASRGKSDGTYNYVIWDESLLTPEKAQITVVRDLEFSREMPSPRVAERVNTSARDALQTGGDVFNAAKRAVMMLTDLVDVGKKYLPSSEKYLALLRRSQSDKGKAERGIASVMEDFYRLKSDAERGTGPGSVNAFLKASTEAKKWGFVPDWLPKGSVEVDPLMKAKFAALSPEAQKVVQRVFQHGHDSIQALREQALATIASEHDVALHAARKSGDAAAIKRAEDAKLRASQDFANLADLDTSWPYAPLKRFGNFVVIARSNELAEAERVLEDHEADEAERSEARKRVKELRKDPKHYGVWFREGRREARKLAEQVRAQGGFGKVENFARESQQYAARGDMMSAFYRLRDLVDNSTDEALREKSSQALRQLMADLHLSLLSEQSARQSGRRRDTVLGADDDMMRAFESQGRALAHFTASLHNNREIQDALAAMRREARDDANAGTVEQRQDLFNEVLKRHMMGLDYRTGLGPELVSKAMAATSTWMLLTSLGYHINNATQPWAMSMPVMAAKHGYARAGKALIAAYKDVWPAIKDGTITQDDFAALPEDVRAAVNQLADDGSIMISLESTYGRWSSTDNPVVSKVAHKLNRMAQAVEAVNRLATAVAAVRLERERGSDGVAFARQVIDKTHGEYADWNAPAFMRTPLGRLATQFRKFQIIQATLFIRMAHDSFKGASAEERHTARVALGYSFMHMGLLGGLVGMPAFSLFSWMLGGLFSGGDEPFDLEEWIRSKAGQSFLGRMATRGVPFAMGVDVSGRVGAGNMLSLLPYTDLKATRDGWSSIVAASMGPFVGGLMPRAWEGAGLMMDGQMWKGLEGFMPKGAQDFSKALRSEAQGVTNKRGDVLLRPDELSIMDGLLQGIGLPSTKVTERSYKAGVKYRVEEFYKKRSDALQRQYTEAVRKGDDEAKQEVRQAWMETQAARRELGFKPQPLATLLRAAASQHKRQQQTVGGIPFNKGNEKYVRRLVGDKPDDEDEDGDAGLEDDADEDDE